MCSLTEEERVIRVLRDLRERTESEVVRNDVVQLERTAQQPSVQAVQPKGSDISSKNS
ncbi:hypothetical protein KIN20_003925 [Parelaphostrongylus tenuis]|uniref:Uncharacterized protein n=1 Tax=Parelaphostrongylus tenuis TaxID=148309 RepID=A0AAD5MGG7_PARTN|nr:hypothetical protein KIN20_003925 [Parelaphostrongylus tenuis]